MDGFFSRARRDRGASGIEYAALVTVATVVVAALLLTVSGVFAEQVGSAICRVFGGNCESGTRGARPLTWTRCNVDDKNRSLGFNLAFRGIRGDAAGKDGIVTQVVPGTGQRTAQVTLTGRSGLGVETGDRTDVGKLGKLNDRLKAGGKGKISVSAFAGINTELGFRYDFNGSDGKDPYAAAQKFLDSRRGSTWKRVLSGLGGSEGEAVENGAAEVVHGAKKAWAWIRGKDTRKMDAEEGQTPTAITFRVGEEATAGGQWSGAKQLGGEKVGLGLEAGAEGKQTASGDVTVVVDDKKNPQNNGMRIFTQRFTLDASGKLQGGADFGRLFPGAFDAGLKAALEGGAGVAGTQSVTFDRNGVPTRFTLQLDTEWKGGKSLTVKGGPNDKKTGSDKHKGTEGHKTSRLYSLDLTEPENRAAFDRLFVTVGGMVAVPRLQSPRHLGEALDQYGRAFAAHGQLVQFEYDTSGNTIEGGSVLGEKGIKRKGFGAGMTDDKTWARYRSGKYFDNEAPSAGWQALANCPRG
ncbi:hypothetical protein [Actinomadura violacea]|uniref:Uncharacterized protein n=1 Tax=Actinomadura violacea TaxID=2819934 RepID=A0ABS3RQ37_9ACTN|nr:hypothetical protein [Actinomadura violacea]MBO2458855.1 hypothetical protein [Actinomadura violacea]